MHGGTAAAVLVPLYVAADGELTAVLTKRRDDMRRHAGEISFPGGRQDEDEDDLQQTALREAHEEIGLEREFTEVIGQMPTYTTGTRFTVTPVVALVRPEHRLTLNAYEVADAFEVP
ncbi:MAG: hydrolase, partial [Solirubrobacterales bacterium]|nr:hydrolase [Solirubrobacterales bacterium]